MTINPQPKAAMDAANSLPGSAAPTPSPGTDPEVVAHARRRQFSNADKRRIVEAADRCTKPGEIGALMRREGVYSSSLSTWRRQREAVELAALAPQKRGPKADPDRAESLHIAQLTRENERLKSRLDKAMLVIEVQKKTCSPVGPYARLERREDMMAAARELTPALGAGAACRAVGLWRGPLRASRRACAAPR